MNGVPVQLVKPCPMGHNMKNINSLFNPSASERFCPECNYSEAMDLESADFLNRQEKAMAAQRPGPPQSQR